jgi:hypothetical protein
VGAPGLEVFTLQSLDPPYPYRADSVAVLATWQVWHVDWRLRGSSVPPRALGTMWSTSVAADKRSALPCKQGIHR